MKTFTNLSGSLKDRNTKNAILFTPISSPVIKICIIGLLVIFSIQVNATIYYLKDNTDASVLTNWTRNNNETGANPTNFTTERDTLIVNANESGYIGSNMTIGATTNLTPVNFVRLAINGTLTIPNGVTLTLKKETGGRAMVTINGTLIMESTAQIASISDVPNPANDQKNSIFLNNTIGTLITANANGLDGSIIPATHFTRSFNNGFKIEFNGSAQTTTGLPATIKNLTFSGSGTKTLAGDVAVTQTLTVKDVASLDIASGQLVTAGTLVNSTGSPYGINLLSNANGVIGSLAYTTGTVDASVQFTSKASKVGANYKYQFFGIPFTTMLPNGNFDDSWLFSYDETNTAMWLPVLTNTPMVPIQGYAITQAAEKTYQLTGTLYNAPITSYNLTYTAGNTESGGYIRGENIISNPYTAAIPISSISFTNMEESVAFFNTGSYLDWQGQSGSGSNPGQYLNVPKAQAGTGGLPANISSLQGFLVKVNGPNPGPAPALMNKIPVLPVGTVSIPVPTIKNTNALRAKAEIDNKVYTVIDINGERFGDKVWLFTDAACTKNFDNGYDSRKIKGDELTPQLYAQEVDGNYQVNSVDDINNTLLGFVPGADTEYTFMFTHSNTLDAYPNGIYLVDLLKNITVDITESGSTYTFSTDASKAKAQKAPSLTAETARFKILTSPGMTTNVDNFASNSLKVFCSDKKLIVNNKESLQGELRLFDTSGRLLYTKSFGSGISTFNVELANGVYIVKLDNKINSLKSTLIIK